MASGGLLSGCGVWAARCGGFSVADHGFWGAWAAAVAAPRLQSTGSAVVTDGLHCSSACGISLDQASLVAQRVKNPPAMWETWVRSLGWEDPMEEVIATHSSIPDWRIPMDRRAWQVTVLEVTKSQTRLSNFHFFPLETFQSRGTVKRFILIMEAQGKFLAPRFWRFFS